MGGVRRRTNRVAGIERIGRGVGIERGPAGGGEDGGGERRY